MTDAVEPVAAAVAAHGLPGSLAQFADQPLEAAEWTTLLGHVGTGRLQGLLVQAIVGGALPVDDAQRAQAIEAHRAAMGTCLGLERLLLETVAVLSEGGIDHRVLKGPAVAHLDYPDPALRCFGDVDVLVPSAAFDAAVRVLRDHGQERQMPELRAGFDRRFGKGATFTGAGGLEVDLHRTFVDGRFGLLVRLEDLFRTSQPLPIGGAELLALGAEERFLGACFNAAIGDQVPRLSALRDVAQLGLRGDLDLDAVHRLGRAWEAEPLVARAVGLTWRTLRLADIVELSSWAERFLPSRSDARALRPYLEEHRTWGGIAFGGLRALRGLTAKAAYLRALFLPQRSHLDSRNVGVTTRWVRGVHTLVRHGRRPGAS